RERLRPRPDSELAQRPGRHLPSREPRTRAAERPHRDHGDVELGRERQQLALAFTLERVERQLYGLKPSRAQRQRKLGERRRRIMGDPEQLDPARGPFLLEPRQLLLPRREVVNLLDLDLPEEAALRRVLPAAL